MLHFLSKLLWKLCLATSQEWVLSFCTSSYHKEGAWSFCISLCTEFILCFWHYFVHAWVPCSTSLAMLAKQAHANFCATVLSQRRNNHTPSPQYAAIHVLQLRTFKTGSQYLLANTGTSMVDRHKITFLGQ